MFPEKDLVVCLLPCVSLFYSIFKLSAKKKQDSSLGVFSFCILFYFSSLSTLILYQVKVTKFNFEYYSWSYQGEFSCGVWDKPFLPDVQMDTGVVPGLETAVPVQ